LPALVMRISRPAASTTTVSPAGLAAMVVNLSRIP
jgi:hypothetical protein